MLHFTTSDFFLPGRYLRALLFSGVAALLLTACTTANEHDTGANQTYVDPDAAAARPTLPGPAVAPAPVPRKPRVVAAKPRRVTARTAARTASTPSPRSIERIAGQSRQTVQYSPMVERTSTGVRTTKGFSEQARSKQQRDNAAAVKTYKTQQNARMARAYNNNNLLTR